MDLGRLLHPRSVAVVGATEREDSYAGQTLLNLASAGFPGPVWGVNPGRTEVYGRACLPALSDLPEVPDAVAAAARLASATGELLLEAGLELIELNPVLVHERGAIAVDAVAASGAE